MQIIELEHLEVDGVEVPLVAAELHLTESSDDAPASWQIVVTAPRDVHLEPGSARIEATAGDGTGYRAEGVVGHSYPQPSGNERVEIAGAGTLTPR